MNPLADERVAHAALEVSERSNLSRGLLKRGAAPYLEWE